MRLVSVGGHLAARFVADAGDGGHLLIPLERNDWDGLVFGFYGTMGDYGVNGTYSCDLVIGLNSGSTNFPLSSGGPTYFWGMHLTSLTYSSATKCLSRSSVNIIRKVGGVVTNLASGIGGTFSAPSENCSPMVFPVFCRLRRYNSTTFHYWFCYPNGVWVAGGSTEGGHFYTNGEAFSAMLEYKNTPYFAASTTAGTYETRSCSRDESTYGTLDHICIGFKSVYALRLYVMGLAYSFVPGRQISGQN